MCGRQIKPLNFSEDKICKIECSKMEILSRKQEDEDLLPRHSFMDVRVNRELLLAKKWSIPSSNPDSVKWDCWAWETVLTFLENYSCFLHITWLSFHNCFSIAWPLTASINYRAMFQGTSAKSPNGVDIVVLQSCIIDLNTQTIFVTISKEIKNVMKLLKLSLDLCRLPELNKI